MFKLHTSLIFILSLSVFVRILEFFHLLSGEFMVCRTILTSGKTLCNLEK